MTADVQKFFDEDLPAKLAEHADAARRVGAKLQIYVTGGGGGAWFVDASGSVPTVVPGEPGGQDATVTIDAEDFSAYRENPRVNGTSLLFAGKLKIEGNQMLGMRFAQLLALK
ncbi:MAG TPA: SCP2 sterol-binding domain-containing protein [Polyangiaceae bacterium]|nr:SCP2 sterol-binding domain-containing protein [Polyangiaceae bacterium]